MPLGEVAAAATMETATLICAGIRCTRLSPQVIETDNMCAKTVGATVQSRMCSECVCLFVSTIVCVCVCL